MTRIGATLFLSLIYALSIGSPMQSRPAPLSDKDWFSALDSIVDAERAFAGAAAEKGTRDAFLAFLADDAVLFRPQPVPGKKWLHDRPPAPGRLTWRPVYADIAALGDLGYTTGPYEFRKEAADAVPASHGNYFTIWKKQPDGSLKVLMDLGTTNPPPLKHVPDFDSAHVRRPALPRAYMDPAAESGQLLLLDARISDLCVTRGIDALAAYLDQDVRFLRPDRFPVVGSSEVRNLWLSAGSERWAWKPAKAGVSILADLGYTYGDFLLHSPGKTGRAEQSGFYVRIWKRKAEGGWKIALDILTMSPQ